MKKELKGGRRGGRVELWAQTAQPARKGGWLGSLRLWVWGYPSVNRVGNIQGELGREAALP